MDKALEFYTTEFLHTCATECYIIIALIYRRTMKITEGEDTLLLAEKLAKSSKVKDYLLPIIYFNLASIYALNKDHKRAIQAYINSMQISKETTVIIRHIYSIVLENSKMKNIEEVIIWCEKGIQIYIEHPSDESKTYYLLFKHFLAENTNSDNYLTDLQSLIQHFKQRNDYRHAHKYTLKLANFYLNENRYKKATQLYAKANQFLALKDKRNSLEDI